MKKCLKPLTFLSLACVTLVLGGCTKEPVAAAKGNEETKVIDSPDLNDITMAHPELFTLVRVETKKIPNELSVNGTIAPDVSRNVPINALTSGRVIEVEARLGDDVIKGQLLLRMTSPDMASAISEYQKVVADERLARTQLERAQLLYSKGALAQKEVQVAEDTEEKAKVDMASGAQRIRILGGDIEHLGPIIEVRAPVSGTIVEQNVTSAAGVKSLDNSPNLFTIADLSHVWVLCDVYENNLSQVHLGDRAWVRLNAYPDRLFEGHVSNIGSILDPNTRTAKVRIDLANSARLLRPNMFATIKFVSQSAEGRMVVPVSAVLRLQDRDWVFKQLSGARFRKTEVQTLPAREGSQVILSGVEAGDQVAADALQFSRAIENQQQGGEK